MPVDPVKIGPTWGKNTRGGFKLPQRTLGWQIIDWAHTYLKHETGDPWSYTDEQARFILWWYALDAQGRFVYRDGVLQRLKGWGKDPLGATLCLIECVGPCRPDPKGGRYKTPWGKTQPLGVQHPQAWVQTAAVSKEQTKNTMTLFPIYCTQHMIDEYELDIGKEIVYANHGARRIEAVTSSPATLEGARSTFVLRNETHHWLSNNEGHEMDRVIARNLAKAKDGNARALSITNAYEPGEDSVAEYTREAWEKMQTGQAVDVRLLYDSLEAPPEAGLNEIEAPGVIEAVRGDSDWVNVESVVAEIMDVRNPASTSRRYWYNQITAAEDAWIAPQEWDTIAKPSKVEKGEMIALGFDGSLTDDHCSLIGSRISDGYMFSLGVWNPEQYDGEAPRELIDGTVRWVFNEYDVVAFFSDLHPWESYVDAWAQDFGPVGPTKLCVSASSRHAVAWDMRGRQKEFTQEGAERVHREILDHVFAHDGDKLVRQHVVNARRRPNAWGVSFGKENRESQRKVDSLSSLILARMARRAYLILPESKQRRKQQRAVFFG